MRDAGHGGHDRLPRGGRDAEDPRTAKRWPRPPSLAVAIAATLLTTALPHEAAAAPCCMSATAFGVGRLLIWEDFAVGIRTSLAKGLGDWDADGRWRAWRGYDEHEWRSEVWALVGLDRRTSVSLRVPAIVLSRATSDVAEVGGGLGDITAAIRYEILTIGEYVELPAIAATLSILAPTGRAPEEGRTPLAVDVTGRGAWVLALGLGFELTRLPWFVRLDLGVGVPLPDARDDLGVEQRLGVSLDVALAGGVEVANNVVVSLVPHLSWGEPTHLDGTRLAGSGRRDLGVTVAGSWRFDDHWTMQASVDAPIPSDALGVNQSGRLTTSLGLRYGSF